AERGIAPVTLLVDAGAVHRDEQPRVRVVLGHGGDARAVEGEMGADVDVEEVDGLAGLRLDDRRTLPDCPAVLVTGGRHPERVVAPALVAPHAGEGAGEVLVVDLEDDLPVVASVTDDHARASTN